MARRPRQVPVVQAFASKQNWVELPPRSPLCGCLRIHTWRISDVDSVS